MASQIPANICVALDEAMSRVLRAGGLPAGGLGQSFSSILNYAITGGGGGGDTFSLVTLTAASGSNALVLSNAGSRINLNNGTDYLYDNAGVATFNGSVSIGGSLAVTGSYAPVSLAPSAASGANAIILNAGARINLNGTTDYLYDSGGVAAFNGSVNIGTGSTDNVQISGGSTGGTIDTSAGTLGIGNTNATTITLGRAGQIVTVTGTLSSSATATAFEALSLGNGNNGIVMTEGGVLSFDGINAGANIWSSTTDHIFRFQSKVGNSGSAIAYLLNTSNALSTSGALLLSLQNNGTQKFSVDYAGNINMPGTLNATSTTAGIEVLSSVASGSAGSGAFWVNTANTLSTTGDVLLAAYNNGTPEFYVDYAGNTTIKGNTLLGASSQIQMNGIPVLYKDSGAGFANGLTLRSFNNSASGPMFSFYGQNALTSGYLANFYSDNAVTKVFSIDYLGHVSSSGVTASGATSTNYALSIPQGTTLSLKGGTIGGARQGAAGDMYCDGNNVEVVVSNNEYFIVANGGIQSQGRVASFNFQTATGTSYVVENRDEIIALSDDAARTVTLPHAAGAGTCFTIRDISGSSTSGHTITISVATSGNIDGASTYVITPGSSSGQSLMVQLVSDGTNYWSIAKY